MQEGPIIDKRNAALVKMGTKLFFTVHSGTITGQDVSSFGVLALTDKISREYAAGRNSGLKHRWEQIRLENKTFWQGMN